MTAWQNWSWAWKQGPGWETAECDSPHSTWGASPPGRWRGRLDLTKEPGPGYATAFSLTLHLPRQNSYNHSGTVSCLIFQLQMSCGSHFYCRAILMMLWNSSSYIFMPYDKARAHSPGLRINTLFVTKLGSQNVGRSLHPLFPIVLAHDPLEWFPKPPLQPPRSWILVQWNFSIYSFVEEKMKDKTLFTTLLLKI